MVRSFDLLSKLHCVQHNSFWVLQCDDCPAGEESNVVPSKEEPIAYTKCNPCPEGKNSSEKGRMCAECPVGGYTTKGQPGSKNCNFCEASKYLLRRSSTRLDDLCVQFPGIESYKPNAGPAQGGTLLTFYLGAPKPKPEEVSDPRCRFGSVVVAGTFDNIGTVKCLSPRRLRNDGQVAVEVSLNGGNSTPAHRCRACNDCSSTMTTLSFKVSLRSVHL